MSGSIRWTERLPQLRMISDVAGWLRATAIVSRLEVMVFFLGVPGEGLIRAGYIVEGQRNSSSSVRVPPRQISSSLDNAREESGYEVVAFGHLHPGDHLHAFASHIDHENLEGLAPLLSTRLFVPVPPRRETLLLQPGAAARLDRIGRKSLTLSEGAATEAEITYTEAPVEAWVYSVTFSRGRGSHDPLDLYAHAWWRRGCADPACASTRDLEVNDIPVEVVDQPGLDFDWDLETLRVQLKERVKRSYHFPTTRIGPVPVRSYDDVDGGGQLYADTEDETDAIDPAYFTGYRYLRGDESEAELKVAVSRFLTEAGNRATELDGEELGEQA